MYSFHSITTVRVENQHEQVKISDVYDIMTVLLNGEFQGEYREAHLGSGP